MKAVYDFSTSICPSYELRTHSTKDCPESQYFIYCIMGSLTEFRGWVIFHIHFPSSIHTNTSMVLTSQDLDLESPHRHQDPPSYIPPSPFSRFLSQFDGTEYVCTPCKPGMASPDTKPYPQWSSVTMVWFVWLKWKEIKSRGVELSTPRSLWCKWNNTFSKISFHPKTMQWDLTSLIFCL